MMEFYFFIYYILLLIDYIEGMEWWIGGDICFIYNIFKNNILFCYMGVLKIFLCYL